MRPASPSDTVLFICEHGTVRSLIVTLLFERYARQVGLHMTAVSRERIPLNGARIISRVVPASSRLVVVVNVNQNSHSQINY